MIRKEFESNILTDFRGGKGTCIMEKLMTVDEFMGHGRLYGKLTIRPGASIGRHTHDGETESFYILSGNGIFTDDDGSKATIKAGEIALIDLGQSHSIENASDTEDLVVLCLVIFGPAG